MATAIGDQAPAVIRLRESDNVAIAARGVDRGTGLGPGAHGVAAVDPIRPGHKVALVDIPEGAPVLKYGQVIGFASKPIPAGSWVHSHNLRADLFERDYAFATERPAAPEADLPRTFRGFLRPDGRVGTRNYVAVISTVNCSASVSKYVSERFRDGSFRRDFPNVDGVFAITHKGGCGLQFEGPDHEQLERVLAGFAAHPNVAAYVLIGLGCEVGFASHLVEARQLVTLGGVRARGDADRSGPPRVLNIQEQGGIARTVEAGVEAVARLLPAADSWRRTDQPASKLVVGLECGGSDGNSGVTANPALGVAADLLVAQGGSAVLAETPEIYGAEHLLTRRAVSEEVGRKLIDRIRWWEEYTSMFGAEINNNPSPGNKEGGLTTIYEKSLGAVAKGGSTALVDVVRYAERVGTPGLVFMDTPGYDPASLTGLVAGGCNVLVFTTGRGSVSGLKPSPCVKVATNTPMYERLRDDMDLDAGTVLAGEPVEEVGRRLFDLILEVADGSPTKSESAGVGEEEFAVVDRADPLMPPSDRPSWAIAPVIAAQVAALAWLMVVPLPSIEAQRLDAQAAGEAPAVPSIRRAYFLLAADEHLVPLASSLADGGHLAQRVPIVLAALLIAGAAVSLGELALRRCGLVPILPPLARWPLAFVAGATLLAALVLIAGKTLGLAPWPTRIGLGGLLAMGLALRAIDRARQPRARRNGERPAAAFRMPWGPIALGLILTPVLLLMALGAMQPTIEYDALEYHLQGPKEHYQAGRIGFLSHNVYTSMPSAVEMLHLLGMLVLDDWWLGALAGQLLIAGFAPATAALVAATAWRWGSGRAAWVAALVYLTTPWIFRLGTFPFVEGPLCSYHAASVFVAALAWTTPREGPPKPAGIWLFVGLLAGGAMACKYPGLVSAVVPIGLAAMAEAWRRRSWRVPVAFGLGVVVAVGPWLARNVVDTGNPVYPLAFGVFGGSEWDEALDARWRAAHGPRPVSAPALGSTLLNVIGRSDWHSPLYALLVPLALLRRGSRGLVLALFGYVAYLFATWFLLTHRLDRFWLPLLPAAAVLAGIGSDWTRSRPWPAWLAAVLGIGTATNLVFLTTPLCGPTDRTADLDRLRREAIAEAAPSLARLDASLPEGSTALIVGQAGVFPIRREVRYNTVFNRERIEEIAADRSPGEIADALRERGITHVYVDWSEVNRHRKPGGYGFSPVVTPTLFDDLVSSRVLAPPVAMGPDHLLYRVVRPESTAPEPERSP